MILFYFDTIIQIIKLFICDKYIKYNKYHRWVKEFYYILNFVNLNGHQRLSLETTGFAPAVWLKNSHYSSVLCENYCNLFKFMYN